MFVALESYVFDPLGSIVLNATPDSELSASTRRVSRTATLDGNAALIDNGWTAADSTLTIEAHLTAAEEATIQRLIRVYPEVVCSTDSGCYLGVIEFFRRVSSGRFVISFLIQRDMTQERQVTDTDIPGPPAPVDNTVEYWAMYADDPDRIQLDVAGTISAAGLPSGTLYQPTGRSPIFADGDNRILFGIGGVSPASSFSVSTDRLDTWDTINEATSYTVLRACFDSDAALLTAQNPGGFEVVLSSSGDLTDWIDHGSIYFDGEVEANRALDVAAFGGDYYVAGVTQYGPESFGLLRMARRTGTGTPWTWEPVSAGVAAVERQRQYLAASATRLLALIADGRMIYSADGDTWSPVIDSAMAADSAIVRDIAFGAGLFVVVDGSGPARIYVADDSLIFQAYTIGDLSYGPGDELYAVAYGHGKFRVTGSQGAVIEFTTPGDWAVIDAGFESTDVVSGIAYLSST